MKTKSEKHVRCNEVKADEKRKTKNCISLNSVDWFYYVTSATFASSLSPLRFFCITSANIME